MTTKLTPKEQLVHDLLVFEGLTDGEMAQRLGMTERAVKFHVQNLLQKTQAPDRFKMAVAFWRATSGWNRKNRSVPAVRRRDEASASSRRRGPKAASRSVARKKKTTAAKKKPAARKSSTRKKVSAKRAAKPARRTASTRTKKRARR